MKIRKSHIIISSVALLAIALVAIQYFHFRGVKDTLERLVIRETKGLYKLDLGETKYDFIRLDFTLKNASIHRMDTINNKRIYSVEFPFVQINLGSMESYFDFKQITVKEFVVHEPVIELQVRENKKVRLNVTTELVKVLHMIKEVLDNFNVHSFKIIKGSFALNKGNQSLRVSLVDFLAREWNVRKLSNERQVEINFGAQSIDIFNHAFSFEQIEYSYQKRQLRVSDFTYHHIDTLTGAKLDARGGAFVIDHINWDELYSTETYKLKKIELIDAEIRGSFPASAKKKTDGNFFKVIRDAVDELMIDSLMVRHANVHLAYKQKEDSTSVSFEDASFMVADFKLLDTDEAFEVGQVRFNLNETSVTLGKKYSVRFDSLLYNRHANQQLSILGVTVSDRHAIEPFFVSEALILTRFNPFDLLLNKKIKAKTLALNNTDLIMLPERLKSGSPTDQKQVEIDIEKLNLNHVGVRYADENKNIAVSDLNLSVKNILLHEGRKSKFDFDVLNMIDLNYADLKAKKSIHGKLISLQKDKLILQSLKVTTSQYMVLSFDAVALKFDELSAKKMDHINSLHARNLSIQGSQPLSNKKNILPNLIIDQIALDTITIDMKMGGAMIDASAIDFKVDHLKMDSLSLKWKNIQTGIPKFSVENDLWFITGGSSQINSGTTSRLSALKLIKKDSTITLTSDGLVINSFTEFEQLPYINLLRPAIHIHQNGVNVNGTMESVSVTEFTFSGKPYVKEVNVHHPTLNVQLFKHNTKLTAKKFPLLPQEVGQVFIHHADIILNKENAPVFFYNLNAGWKHGSGISFQLDSLTTKSIDFKISLRKMDFMQNHFRLGSMDLNPLQDIKTYSQSGLERDWLKLNFDNVSFTGFSVDSLLFGQRMQLDEVNVGAFQVNVLRDKRLPDAPFEEKELFSRKLYCLSKPVNIPLVRFANGSVYVRQISDKTNETGKLEINSISGTMKNIVSPMTMDKKFEMDATAQMYNHGQLKVIYRMKDLDHFTMDVQARDLEMQAFNSILQPLESVKFKSGKLKTLNVNADAGNHKVTGDAMVSYEGLKVKILKSNKTAFGNELTTAVANEIIRNDRHEAIAQLSEERDRGSSEFTYWVKIALKGAMGAARHGKKRKIGRKR